ncbi:MAG: hypothetical protein GX616_08000 [Planctomycetes bacterium]|nr:hypothetical protein [Planctomycetota bacterium]
MDYILAGLAVAGVIIFVVLIRRQLRWSHPAKGRGAGYDESGKPGQAPVTARNPAAPSGGGH